MRPGAARSRCALVLIALAATIAPAAAVNRIYAQAVQTCSNETAALLQVDTFDISFYPDGIDGSSPVLAANIVGRSLNNDVSPTLRAVAVQYGMQALDETFDVCSVLFGALCPLPTFRFAQAGILNLESGSLDLPGIAFRIPNIEASVRVTLTNQATGQLAACLDVALSNGWTTAYPGVQWALGGVAIAAYIAAVTHAFFPLSPRRAGPQWRFLTLINLYQFIATCGYLSLNYPALYQVFTLNFDWAMFLIPVRAFTNSFDRARYNTGGEGVPGDLRDSNSLLYDLGIPRSRVVGPNLPNVASGDPLAQSSRGLEQLLEQLGIPFADGFMTVFVFVLLLCAVTILICAIGYAIFRFVLRRRRHEPEEWRIRRRQDFSYFLTTSWLRVLLVSYYPLVLFSFFTFRIVYASGWAFTLLAVLSMIISIAGVAIVAVYVQRIHRARKTDELDEKALAKYSRRWYGLMGEYKQNLATSFVPTFVLNIARAAFVAFAQGSPWVQVIALLVIELISLVALCVWRPFQRTATNVLEIFLAVVRVVSIGLLIPFIGSVVSNRYIVTGIGVGIFVIQAAAVLILVVATIFNLFAGLLWARTERAKAERAVPIGEKATVAGGDADSDQTMREVEGGDGFGVGQRRPLDADLETATLYDVNPSAQPTAGDKPIDYAHRTDEQHPSPFAAPTQPPHAQTSGLQQPSALTPAPYPTYQSAPDSRAAYY